MSEVWLIRHGESQANAGEVTRYADSSALTRLGRAQANDVADAIEREPDLLVCTPFLRSQQSALPLLVKFPDATLEEWPLHEFTYLAPEKYHNTSFREREPEKTSYWRQCDPNLRTGPGAESFVDFVARIGDGVRRLRAIPGFVVVVTHGHVMRAMIWYILEGGLRASPEAMRRYDHLRMAIEIPNCAIVKLTLGDGEPRMSGLLTDHLASD